MLVRCFLSGLMVMLILPAVLRGQSVPTTPSPAEPEPAPAAPGGGTAGVSDDESTGSRWTLGLIMREYWDGNVEFESATEQGDLVSYFGVRLTRVRHRERTQITLAGNGGAYVYRELSDRNRFNYGGDVTASHQLSPRTTVTFSGGHALSYTRDVPALETQGLLLQLSRVSTSTAACGISRRVSLQTTVSGDVRYERFDFDATELTDGSALSAGASLSRRISRNHSLSFAGGYRRSLTDRPLGDTYNASGAWSVRLKEGLNASASMGASYIGGEDRPGRWAPVGGVGVTGRFRHGTLGLQYSHDMSPAFGFGRDRVADVLGLNYGRSFGRRLNGSLAAGYSFSRDPHVDTFRFTTATYAASLNYVVSRRLTVAAGHFLRRRGALEGEPALRGSGWEASLSYRRDWR